MVHHQDRALRALNRVLGEARLMALEDEPGPQIAEVLDWAELLPRFMADARDKTEDFSNALAAIAEKQPRFQHAVGIFAPTRAVHR